MSLQSIELIKVIELSHPMNPHMRTFMLQAYLNRELDSSAEAEFELALLADPDLAEQAAGDTALLIGLSGAEAAAATSSPSNVAVLPVRRAAKPWLMMAAAASALMLISASLGYFLKPAPNVLGGAQLAYIDKQRSVGNGIQIKLPKAGPLVLMVPVASANPCVANISIGQAGQVIQASAQPDDFGYAVVVLGFNALKPGAATVDVRCEGKAVGQYVVQVLP
jgi:hypothetical protein